MHSPTHFTSDPTQVCEIQRASRWTALVETLGLTEEVRRAICDPRCAHCRRIHEDALRERDLAGLLPIADVLQEFATYAKRLQAGDEPGDLPAFTAAVWEGSRVGVEAEDGVTLYGGATVLRILLRLPKYQPDVPLAADTPPAERAKRTVAELTATWRGFADAMGVTVHDVWGGFETMVIAVVPRVVAPLPESSAA